MSVETTQFVRKPIYVDAVRVTKDNFDEIVAWCQGEKRETQPSGKGPGKPYIRIRAHNPINSRQTKAFVGDWILYTERGYKIYTNKAFKLAFNPTDPERAEGDIVMGSDEVMPGVTLNEAIKWLRSQPEGSVTHIRDAIQSGECIVDRDIARVA